MTELLLETIPALRKDSIMCLAYDFILNSIASNNNIILKVIKRNEDLLASILEASKVSSAAVDKLIVENIQEVS